MPEGIVIPVKVNDQASGSLDRIGRSVSNLEDIVSAQALLGFAETIASWAMEGDRASDVLGAMALDMTGLQRATAGTVDAMSLAEASNRALAAGLNLSQRETEAVVAAAANYARTTGTDANAATNQLISALVSGRERGLRPFGIQAGDTASAIAALTGRLGENETALRENSGALDRTATQVSDLKVEFQQLAADGVETFLAAIGLIGSRTEAQMDRALASAQTFAARFNRIAVSIGNALGFQEGMTAEQASHWAGTAEGVAEFRQRGFRSRREIDIFVANAQRTGGNVREMLGRIPRTESGQAEADRAADSRRQRQADETRDARIDRAWDTFEREGPAERRRGGGGGGGGRRAANDDDEGRAWARDWAERLEEEQAEYEDRRLRAGPAYDGRQSSRRESNLSVGRARRADGPSDRNGLRNVSREVASLEAAYEQLGDTATSVLDAMGAATAAHFEAWALGRETMGEALAGMTADLFKWMGQQALKKAGMEAIEAIAAAARYDFGAAALHTAAAVGFGALAAGGFALSGAVSPSRGASTHGRDDAGRSTTRDLGARGEMGGGQPLVINNYWAPMSVVGEGGQEQATRMFVGQINSGVRRNLPGYQLDGLRR